MVVNVSRIGDTLYATPAIRAIAQHWPLARITVLGHPKRIEVLDCLPFIHRIGSIDNRRSRWQGWLRRGQYDLSFVFGYDAPLVRYALRVSRLVVAFRQPNEVLNRRLYRAVEPAIPGSMHDAELRLMLTDAIGIEHAGRELSYSVGDAERAWAKEKLRKDGIGNRHPLIGLQIASFPTKSYRDWPLENFSALCRRILERWPSAHFVIFGGELELERTQALHRQFASHATHYAGRLSLRQTAAIMQQLDLYIGVDTGPTHIAGALGITMVALYHPYLPGWRVAPPPRPNLFVVDHPLANHNAGPETPMAGITVEQVWAEVNRAMAGFVVHGSPNTLQ